MCRHVGWLGEPRSLRSLVFDPTCGLVRQGYAPRRQRHGRINADGWGVGWWTAARPEPARWRSTGPIWADASLQAVAPHVSAPCLIAAVRSATPGMPVDETACSPFARGRWLLSHNGRVDRSVLPVEAWQQAESVCDSAILAAWVLDHPEDVAARLAAVAARDPHARLNLLVADGRRMLATTWGDTLSVLITDQGVVVASEPYDDDPRWRDVPDRTLLTVATDGVALTDLEPM
jgi:gamma-glutamyl hercynylcysteine S-oxide hydrolase